SIHPKTILSAASQSSTMRGVRLQRARIFQAFIRNSGQIGLHRYVDAVTLMDVVGSLGSWWARHRRSAVNQCPLCRALRPQLGHQASEVFAAFAANFAL